MTGSPGTGKWHPLPRLAAAAVCAVAAAAGLAADPAQQAFVEARDHQRAYDAYYIASNDLVEAQAELDAAIRAYADGASRFPGNDGFNFGLGVLHNIRAEYPQAIEAFRLELEIMDKTRNKRQDADRFIATSGLAEAYEGVFDYTNALRFYSNALACKPGDRDTLAAIERCRRLPDAFGQLEGWLSSGSATEGTVVHVVYDLSPRTYPGTSKTVYRIEKRDGRAHVYLEVPVTYRGQKTSRTEVDRRLARISALVEECFARSSIQLHLSLDFRDPDLEPASGAVSIWDHYQPPDRRSGDALNWPVLSVSGLMLTPEMAASVVAHEVGHLLGLGHPPYYPEKPYADIMTAGYPWSGIGSKRVFPDDVRIIAGPLVAPAKVRGVLKRADDLLTAGKAAEAAAALDTARKLCPGDPILQLAYANAAFDASDCAAAAEAYSVLLKARPHDDQILLLRGVSNARARRYAKAVEDFTRIVAGHSGGAHAVAYIERAAVHDLMGLYDKAATDREKSAAAVTNPVPDAEARQALGLPPVPGFDTD